jgi:RNA polymerase sigma-70 factor, ECF subfamily
MPVPAQEFQEFEEQLVSFMPKMRIWALAMTRNSSAADDLTQDVAAKALAASSSFEPDTNFGAWLRRIMLNHFISGVRSRRNMVGLDEMPDLSIGPSHEDSIALKEVSDAVNRLPPALRSAFLMVVVDEGSYEDSAEKTGWPIGTIKIRVHRARLQLRALAA